MTATYSVDALVYFQPHEFREVVVSGITYFERVMAPIADPFHPGPWWIPLPPERPAAIGYTVRIIGDGASPEIAPEEFLGQVERARMTA